jgi:hypothetical protein
MHIDGLGSETGVDETDRFAAPVRHGLRRRCAEIENLQSGAVLGWLIRISHVEFPRFARLVLRIKHYSKGH